MWEGGRKRRKWSTESWRKKPTQHMSTSPALCPIENMSRNPRAEIYLGWPFNLLSVWPWERNLPAVPQLLSCVLQSRQTFIILFLSVFLRTASIFKSSNAYEKPYKFNTLSFWTNIGIIRLPLLCYTLKWFRSISNN